MKFFLKIRKSVQNNMLYKRGDQCLITTIPSDLYPVDGALKAKEIVDVLEEEDLRVQHSVLFGSFFVENDSLKQPILQECSSATIRRVREEKVTDEQKATLEDGGVVFVPHKSKRTCVTKSALRNISEDNSWYWPNPDTGVEVAVHNIIHMVDHLTCCVNTPGAPCCDTTYPNLCLCDDINTQQNFGTCLGEQRILCGMSNDQYT